MHRPGLCIVLAFSIISSLGAQTKDQVKQEAEAQLQQMTPGQIDAKIKESGMTRQEAESKARDLGIDLNSYLQQKGSPTGLQPTVPPAETTKAAIPSVDSPRKQDTIQKLPAGRGRLPLFGYDVFTRIPSAFEPSAVGPVDPEYVIGPDDVLRVTVWGQVEFQNELTVDKEGKVFIPTVGQMLVTGLTLESAFDKLKKQMSRSYSGLVSQPPRVWMDVTLARLRPKRVFIMGEIVQPGGYTVSSYANVFSSLYGVGGPTAHGSLRDIRVIRGNKTIAHVDLYQYLTGAEQTNDVRVQSNDIIFVPARGKTVAIDREVGHPAIYELLPGENLRRLLEFAGGALNTAYLERVQVDRIIPFRERTNGGVERRVIDVNFREILNANKDYELADGDSISVYSIFDMRLNIVTLKGAVGRPGQFQLEKTPTIRSLIAAAEGLQPKADLNVGHLIRLNEDMITQRIIPFDVRKALDAGQTDWKLSPRDEVIIYSIEATEVKNKYVTIFGEVKAPGRYNLPDGMTLADLVLLAGGPTEEADALEAEVSRVLSDGISGDSVAVLLRPKLPARFSAIGRISEVDGTTPAEVMSESHFELRHRDEVFIRANPHYRVQQDVTIEGDIWYPGVYTIHRRDERLSEVLARAGGPTSTSYFGGAEFYRGSQRLLLDFEKAYFDENRLHDVFMNGGDRIVIPSRPYTVLVTGEVNKPGLLSFISGDDVSAYIDRAGGLTDSSLYAVLIKPTGESNRVNFGFMRADPDVPEGSTIRVLKIAPSPPDEKGESVATTVKDIFAIATSAATIAFLIWQVTK